MNLFTPKGKRLQGLTRRFWQQYDDATSGSEIFGRVRTVMTSLRHGLYGREYETPLTDQEAYADLQAKLADFAEAYDNVEDDEPFRKYHAIPWVDGVACETFAWFAVQGEAGREFFEDQQYEPDCFIKQADIDFARQLAELKSWDEVKFVYQNHEFSWD